MYDVNVGLQEFKTFHTWYNMRKFDACFSTTNFIAKKDYNFEPRNDFSSLLMFVMNQRKNITFSWCSFYGNILCHLIFMNGNLQILHTITTTINRTYCCILETRVIQYVKTLDPSVICRYEYGSAGKFLGNIYLHVSIH